MTKDYVSIASEYRNTSQYRKLDEAVVCVLCHTHTVTTVFFPCQHKCVCKVCIDLNNIGKPSVEGSWLFCSICNEQIKLALEHDGEEVVKYWAWVNAVKPPMPPNFVKNFTKKSNANIKIESGGKVKFNKFGLTDGDENYEESGGGGGGRGQLSVLFPECIN